MGDRFPRMMTLKQTAEALCISYKYALNKWPEWERWGIHAHRPLGRKKILFLRDEVESAIRASRVN